ncbi:MAG: hypothetical protein SFV54_12075 [Bryobacteraceae bacterium]|nr:hypothetical protein [Bryobacteraceae bacterium]
MHQPKPQSRRRTQRGGVLVEGALTMTSVLFLVVTVVDLAQFFFIQQSLAERVRYATRRAGVQVLNATAITNLILYDSPTVTGTPPRYFGLNSSNVDVQITGLNTNAARVRVKISGYSFPMISPFFQGLQGIPITVSTTLEVP